MSSSNHSCSGVNCWLLVSGRVNLMSWALVWFRELGNPYQIPIRSSWCHIDLSDSQWFPSLSFCMLLPGSPIWTKGCTGAGACPWCELLVDLWYLEVIWKRERERGRKTNIIYKNICCVYVIVRTASQLWYVCNWGVTIFWCITYITYIGLSELFQLAYNTYAYVASKTYWERWTNCLVLNYAGFQCRFEGRFVHTIQLI